MKVTVNDMEEKQKKAENGNDKGTHNRNRKEMRCRKHKASEKTGKEQNYCSVNTAKKDKKEKRKNKDGKEKKKLPLKRTAANNLFALKILWKSSPSYLIIYLASSFVYGILGFLSESYLLRKIVNGIQSGENIKSLMVYVSVLGIITVITYTGMNWFWQVIGPVKQRAIGAYVEKMLLRKSAEADLACYENPEFYDKYVRAMDEAYDRIMKVMYTLYDLIARVIALTANSFLLFTIDPWLILFGLFPLVLGIFRRLENVANHDMEIKKKTVNRRMEYVRRTFYLGEYAKEMRVGGMYINMLREFRESYDEYRKIVNKYGLRIAAYGFIQDCGLQLVTILGATLYSVWSAMCIGSDQGGMLLGDCIVVIGGIGTISFCLNNLVQNFAEFGEHSLFLEDVRCFLDYEPKIKDGKLEAPSSGGGLCVHNVSFRYDGSDKDVLRNVSFDLHPGERIALVGSNGSGKTTLVKLLLRLYDPIVGEITMDGRDIKEYTLMSYRDCFSTVLQDYKMFSLTVRENVLLRPEKEGDRELVEAALSASGVSERIDRLEHGIDTVLTREFDDRGAVLSLGEQQKLSLARVFASDSPFVLLDEPSSALDPIAEYNMFENMIKATKGRSVIFISHRLSSAALADRVILMDEGRIAEMGTHGELMAKGGKYADMFRRQAENYLGSEVSAND